MHDSVEQSKTNGLATASLILGILSFVTCAITGVPAIIGGAIAQGRIGRSEGRETGSGAAITGIVTGSITTVGGVLLITLLLPAVHAARMAAQRAQSSNNLKRIGLGLHTFHDQHRAFPPDFTTDEEGAPLQSWRTLILPYTGESVGPVDEELAWDDPANAALTTTPIRMFQNPADDGIVDALDTCYVAVVDPEFFFTGGDGMSISDIADGTSNTIMVVAVDNTQIPWAEPRDITWAEFWSLYDSKQVSSFPTGVQALYADGAVLDIPYGLSEDEVRGLFTRAGGEPFPVSMR